MLSHGDTPICKNLVCLCQRAQTSCQTQIHSENITLILRSKVKVIQSSWMYETHCTMVIHSRAKQSLTMSKDKKDEAWTQSHVINPINLTLSSKVVSGSWMYLTHPLMVIDPCAKYGMPMSKQTEVTCWTWRHDKSLRSKVNIQLRSWMYATHRFMVIHPCAKYGKPMSNQKIQHTHWGPPNILQSQGWSFRF